MNIKVTGSVPSDAGLPNKEEDQWTISPKFREDLTTHFQQIGKNMIALEVGSYLGYTTRTLSGIFKRVREKFYTTRTLSGIFKRVRENSKFDERWGSKNRYHFSCLLLI